MSQIAAKGERVFKHQLGQLIDEQQPGVYDPQGRRVVLTCLEGEFQSEETWDRFRPDGFSVDSWAMMSKEWRIYTANVAYDFPQNFELIRMLLGAPTVTNPAPSGAYEESFALPSHCSISRQTRTLEWGFPDSVERCPYFFPISASHNADRDGTRVDGQWVFLCRKPIAVGVPMTGEARSAAFQISAVNAEEDGVFPISINGAPSENLTIEIGDSEADIEAKLLAMDIIADVNGSVATATGEIHTLNAVNATGNATIYGDIVVTPGMSAADLEDDIQAKGGDYADVIVGGSTTVADPGTVITGTASASTAGTDFSADGAFDGSTGWRATESTGAWLKLVAASPKRVTSYKIKPYSGNMYTPTAWKIDGSNDGENWTTLDTKVGQTFASEDDKSFSFANVNSYTQYRITLTATDEGGAVPIIAHLQFITEPVQGTGFYTIAFDEEAGNVPNITPTPGTGWTTGVTEAGNAGGTISINVLEPENTPILLGNTESEGWSGSVTQYGDNGRITIPKRRPVNPARFGIRIADTRAGLANAALIGKSKRLNWSLENGAEPVFFAMEGETTFQSHSDSEERSVGLELAVSHDSPVVAILEAKLGSNKVSNPFWIELRELGEAHEVHKYQFYAVTSGPRARTALGKVLGYTIPLSIELTDTPLNADLVADGGASMYVVLRKPAV
jgi:hypothetical protein